MALIVDGSNSAVTIFPCFVASVDLAEVLMLAGVLLLVLLAAVFGVLIFAWGYRCGEERRIVKPTGASSKEAAFFMPPDKAPEKNGEVDEPDDTDPLPPHPRIQLRI